MDGVSGENENNGASMISDRTGSSRKISGMGREFEGGELGGDWLHVTQVNELVPPFWL